jgi:hypothetical protein
MLHFFRILLVIAVISSSDGEKDLSFTCRYSVDAQDISFLYP